MVPVGVVAEYVAIKSRLTEIVQTVEILRCELVVSQLVMAKLIVAKLIVGERVGIVTKIMRGELMTAAAHGVTSTWRAVSVQCMATPPMTHGGQPAMGSKSMKCTASGCRTRRHTDGFRISSGDLP